MSVQTLTAPPGTIWQEKPAAQSVSALHVPPGWPSSGTASPQSNPVGHAVVAVHVEEHFWRWHRPLPQSASLAQASPIFESGTGVVLMVVTVTMLSSQLITKSKIANGDH